MWTRGAGTYSRPSGGHQAGCGHAAVSEAGVNALRHSSLFKKLPVFRSRGSSRQPWVRVLLLLAYL